MCRIWEQKRDKEISPAELEQVLADPLFDEIENVGLNGGEPTLRPDLARLAEVMIDRLPRLKGLSLITNAIRDKRVIAAVDELGALCQARGKHLDVMVSLDGVGDVHDRVRGVPGNFEAAMRVLDHLQASPLVNSYRIGCTIIAENAFGIEDVLALAKARGVYARFRMGVPHPRLYSDQLTAPFFLTPEAVFHVAAFLDTLVCEYETNESRRAFYVSLRDQLTDGRPRAAGCAWRNHGATLGPRGEFSYCAVASPVLGNVLKASAAGLYWGGKDVLEQIQRDHCAGCRHDYEGIGSRRVLLKVWAKRLAAKLPRAVLPPVRTAWRGIVDWRNYRRAGQVRVSGAVASGVRRVLLCGWYGTETLGDRAILAGLCGLLREVAPEAVIDVASLNPYVTRETVRLMPEMGVSDVLDMTSAKQAIASGRYGVVAVAGGPLMTPVREVIDLYHLLRAARQAGARTALLGCGLGPISGRGPRRRAIAAMVNAVDVCVLRDAASANMACEVFGRIGVTGSAADPAFFWVTSRDADTSPVIAGRPVVALALREWLPGEYALGLAEEDAAVTKQKFEAELIRMVRRFRSARPDVLVVPVCMHTLTQGGDDRWFYQRLFADEPELQASVVWQRRTPLQELALLRDADGVVAMRFHSAVFALGLGKPLLAIDYTLGGKVSALLNESGNAGRMVTLMEFDGEAAADRLLADISAPTYPRAVDLSDSHSTYTSALRELMGAEHSE